ncbi:hypothetical protein, partial [Azospirillum formosense]|uniref:hypothetical protein n=1 Tax=Azospirillum formosense TaxID=861533 RepID=UPI003CE558A9
MHHPHRLQQARRARRDGQAVRVGVGGADVAAGDAAAGGELQADVLVVEDAAEGFCCVRGVVLRGGQQQGAPGGDADLVGEGGERFQLVAVEAAEGEGDAQPGWLGAEDESRGRRLPPPPPPPPSPGGGVEPSLLYIPPPPRQRGKSYCAFFFEKKKEEIKKQKNNEW